MKSCLSFKTLPFITLKLKYNLTELERTGGRKLVGHIYRLED